MNQLQNKRILITGASDGLGRQLAIDFAVAGAAAVALVARSAEKLNAVCETIRQLAPDTTTIAIVADLRNAADLERVVATTLDAFAGKLDVLVNNAATLGPVPMPLLVDYPDDKFLDVLQLNVLAPFSLIKKTLPALIAASGTIINVTSDAGITGYPGFGAYGISKFALEGLSQTWSAELDGTGVRVNWVDPGDMNTQMHRQAEPEEDPSQWANPSEVTGVFIYLASDAAKGISGRRFEAQGNEDIKAIA
jgi:NAD(P)-dependent dehydrogenase (short-subunit alcohol dehydrogenase family)